MMRYITFDPSLVFCETSTDSREMATMQEAKWSIEQIHLRGLRVDGAAVQVLEDRLSARVRLFLLGDQKTASPLVFSPVSMAIHLWRKFSSYVRLHRRLLFTLTGTDSTIPACALDTARSSALLPRLSAVAPTLCRTPNWRISNSSR